MIRSNIFYIILISFYAFLVNWVSGNVGVMPIDTFSFMDTGNSILYGKYPIRDFWIFSGFLLDYIQALFFILFGKNWAAYVSHASFFNIIISLSAYITFTNLKIERIYSFFYALSVATLCYPVAGTPFAYQHSFILSLISIFITCLAIKGEKDILWFALPTPMLLSFLSQQTPSSYINILLILTIFYHFFSERKYVQIKNFIFGALTIFILFILFLIITGTSIKDFIIQYILFPLSIGSGRILNEQSAYLSFSDQLNIKRLIGDFKFIHIFLVALIFITSKQIFAKTLKLKKHLLKINILLVVSTILFIFHQLITANQIFIFCLIPVIAAYVHMNLNFLENNKIYYKFFIILLIIFCTIKYHYRFNVERKFMDLQSVDLSLAVPANELSPKLKYLKWITPFSYSQNPREELKFLNKVYMHLKEDRRNKLIITHYHFLSLLLKEDINLLNRWYLRHHTHPQVGNKYFKYYINLVNKNLKKNNIEVVYLISSTENEMKFEDFKAYFTSKCFENNNVIENRFYFYEIKDCK